MENISKVQIRFKAVGTPIDKDKDILESIAHNISMCVKGEKDYKKGKSKKWGIVFVIENKATTFVIRRANKGKWYVLEVRGDELNMVAVIAYVCLLQTYFPKWEIPFMDSILDFVMTR